MISDSTSSILRLTPPDAKEQHYGSFRTKLSEANQEAKDCFDYLHRIHRMIRSSVIFTCVLVLLLLLPVSMIFVGSSFQEECPKEPRILIYLLVTGSMGTLKIFLSLWRQISFRRTQNYDGYYNDHYDNDNGYDYATAASINDDYDDDDDDESQVVTRMLKFTNNFLTVFLTIWFVLGNIWVFGIWWPQPSRSLHRPRDWCNPTVFLYCVVHIFTVYGLVGFVLSTVFVLLVAYFCCQR